MTDWTVKCPICGKEFDSRDSYGDSRAMVRSHSRSAHGVEDPFTKAESSQEPLRVDPERWHNYADTGIYVRAQLPDGTWDSVDIIELTKDSLMQWLRSRGGENVWAENVVYLLLGHEQ